MELKSSSTKPSLTQVMPALHDWLAKQEGRAFGLFHAIIIDRQHDHCYADMALQAAKAGNDKDTIRLAELLFAMTPAQRRKLSAIWHFYDPGAKDVPPSKPARRADDSGRGF